MHGARWGFGGRGLARHHAHLIRPTPFSSPRLDTSPRPPCGVTERGPDHLPNRSFRFEITDFNSDLDTECANRFARFQTGITEPRLLPSRSLKRALPPPWVSSRPPSVAVRLRDAGCPRGDRFPCGVTPTNEWRRPEGRSSGTEVQPPPRPPPP